MWESLKNNKVYATLTIMVTLGIPLVGFLGVPFPKPAWSADITRLESSQIQIHIELLEDQKERLELQKLQVERDIYEQQAKVGTVPQVYLRQNSALTTKIDSLDSKLEAARDRAINLQR